MDFWDIQIDPEAVSSILFLITTIISMFSKAVVNAQKKLKESLVQLIERAYGKFSAEQYSGNDKRNCVVEMLYRQVRLCFVRFFKANARTPCERHF